MIDDEEKLLDSFLKGDQSAFSTLFERHYQGACRYVIRLVKDEDTTEEISN